MSLALDTVAGLDSIAAKHGQRGRAQWATIRTMHARALLEAHDTVLRAYLRRSVRKSHPGDTA